MWDDARHRVRVVRRRRVLFFCRAMRGARLKALDAPLHIYPKHVDASADNFSYLNELPIPTPPKQ